jgi:pantoate kinase
MTVKKPPTTKQYAAEVKRTEASRAWFAALPAESLAAHGLGNVIIVMFDALIARAKAATPGSLDYLGCYQEMQQVPSPA